MVMIDSIRNDKNAQLDNSWQITEADDVVHTWNGQFSEDYKV